MLDILWSCDTVSCGSRLATSSGVPTGYLDVDVSYLVLPEISTCFDICVPYIQWSCDRVSCSDLGVSGSPMIWEYQDTSSGKVIWSATAANYRRLAVICMHVFWYMDGFNVIRLTQHSLNKSCSMSMQTFFCDLHWSPKWCFCHPKTQVDQITKLNCPFWTDIFRHLHKRSLKSPLVPQPQKAQIAKIA